MRPILAIVNVLGALVAMFAAYFLLPVVTALVYGETTELWVYVESGAITLALGIGLFVATRRHRAELKPRDGYLLVSLSWLLVTLMAAVPFMRAAPHLSFADAYFEAMSGLSTTGSTVITGLDALPHSVNMWRHALHWLGGTTDALHFLEEAGVQAYFVIIIGAALAILTIIQYPGGIGEQISPITRWLGGKRFTMHPEGHGSYKHEGSKDLKSGALGRLGLKKAMAA